MTPVIEGRQQLRSHWTGERWILLCVMKPSRPSRIRYLHAVFAQIEIDLHGARDPLGNIKAGWSHTSDHTAGDYYKHHKRRVATSRGQTTEVAAGGK